MALGDSVFPRPVARSADRLPHLETFARAVKLFGHQGVVNIASLIGDYAATAILLNVADQHVRDVSLLPVP